MSEDTENTEALTSLFNIFKEFCLSEKIFSLI